jgi:hypothetical protein
MSDLPYYSSGTVEHMACPACGQPRGTLRRGIAVGDRCKLTSPQVERPRGFAPRRRSSTAD